MIQGKAMKVFDYVYYRASKFFFKRDGSDADRAIWLVTSMQALLILDLYLSFAYFAFEDRGKRYHQIVVVLWFLLLTITYLLNRFRYRGRYEEFQSAHRESDLRRMANGILIIFITIFLWFYPVIFLSLFGKSFLNQ